MFEISALFGFRSLNCHKPSQNLFTLFSVFFVEKSFYSSNSWDEIEIFPRIENDYSRKKNRNCIFHYGNTKLERFLPKNQHTQRKWLNFEFWINDELSKSDRIWKSNFLSQKSSESFSIFFSLKNTNLGAHFLLLTLFDNINFSTTLLLKLGQIFDELAKLGKSTQEDG